MVAGGRFERPVSGYVRRLPLRPKRLHDRRERGSVPWITNLHIPLDATHLEDSALREGERSDNIYVVVDSFKIARCAWCGIMESKNWRVSQYGLYCSTKCANANGATLLAVLFVLFVLLSLSVLIASRFAGIGASLYILMIGVPALVCSLQGTMHRKSVPRNSRASEVSRDAALLRTVSASVNCPRCDGNLDLRKIGNDGIYVCGYCGATGAVRIIDRSEQRGSGSGGSIWTTGLRVTSPA